MSIEEFYNYVPFSPNELVNHQTIPYQILSQLKRFTNSQDIGLPPETNTNTRYSVPQIGDQQFYNGNRNTRARAGVPKPRYNYFLSTTRRVGYKTQENAPWMNTNINTSGTVAKEQLTSQESIAKYYGYKLTNYSIPVIFCPLVIKYWLHSQDNSNEHLVTLQTYLGHSNTMYLPRPYNINQYIKKNFKPWLLPTNIHPDEDTNLDYISPCVVHQQSVTLKVPVTNNNADTRLSFSYPIGLDLNYIIHDQLGNPLHRVVVTLGQKERLWLLNNFYNNQFINQEILASINTHCNVNYQSQVLHSLVDRHKTIIYLNENNTPYDEPHKILYITSWVNNKPQFEHTLETNLVLPSFMVCSFNKLEKNSQKDTCPQCVVFCGGCVSVQKPKVSSTSQELNQIATNSEQIIDYVEVTDANGDIIMLPVKSFVSERYADITLYGKVLIPLYVVPYKVVNSNTRLNITAIKDNPRSINNTLNNYMCVGHMSYSDNESILYIIMNGNDTIIKETLSISKITMEQQNKIIHVNMVNTEDVVNFTPQFVLDTFTGQGKTNWVQNSYIRELNSVLFVVSVSDSGVLEETIRGVHPYTQKTSDWKYKVEVSGNPTVNNTTINYEDTGDGSLISTDTVPRFWFTTLSGHVTEQELTDALTDGSKLSLSALWRNKFSALRSTTWEYASTQLLLQHLQRARLGDLCFGFGTQGVVYDAQLPHTTSYYKYGSPSEQSDQETTNRKLLYYTSVVQNNYKINNDGVVSVRETLFQVQPIGSEHKTWSPQWRHVLGLFPLDPEQILQSPLGQLPTKDNVPLCVVKFPVLPRDFIHILARHSVPINQFLQHMKTVTSAGEVVRYSFVAHDTLAKKYMYTDGYNALGPECSFGVRYGETHNTRWLDTNDNDIVFDTHKVLDTPVTPDRLEHPLHTLWLFSHPDVFPHLPVLHDHVVYPDNPNIPPTQVRYAPVFLYATAPFSVFGEHQQDPRKEFIRAVFSYTVWSSPFGSFGSVVAFHPITPLAWVTERHPCVLGVFLPNVG